MRIGTLVGSVMIAVALLGTQPVLALEQVQNQAAERDAKCVKCHSRGLKKKLEDGESMSLKVDVDGFAISAHNVIGCTGCHRDLAKGKHPSRKPIASRHEYALQQNETCRQCHASLHEDYASSIHASLVDAGSHDAPMCSDCHSPHTIQSDIVYQRASGEPCSSCHQDVFQAYEASVHGKAHNHGNTIFSAEVKAPVCADCHSAHGVSAVASTGYLVSTCMECHQAAQQAHDQWLPNAPMHLKSVGCAACHSPDAELRVNLQLYNGLTGLPIAPGEAHDALRQELAEMDTEGESLSAMDLWQLVRLTKANGKDVNTQLRGRLEVANGAEAHSLADSSQATRTCENCHKSDSTAFDQVTVSITRPDGRMENFQADANVLRSVISVDSISGFYAPGGTRIRLLDYLLVLAALGGLAVPVVHISLGKIIRRAQRKAHAGSADKET